METVSRGFTIHYTVAGDGPPLMLLAATLSAAQRWHDLGYVGALASHWRVINVDLLGHGRSDTPHDADSYLAADVTADLVAVLDAEGVDRGDGLGLLAWRLADVQRRRPTSPTRREDRGRRLRDARP